MLEISESFVEIKNILPNSLVQLTHIIRTFKYYLRQELLVFHFWCLIAETTRQSYYLGPYLTDMLVVVTAFTMGALVTSSVLLTNIIYSHFGYDATSPYNDQCLKLGSAKTMTTEIHFGSAGLWCPNLG